jgi:hypothetical protein
MIIAELILFVVTAIILGMAVELHQYGWAVGLAAFVAMALAARR